MVLVMTLGAGLTVCQAQTAATTTPPPQPSEFEQFVTESKNPAPWLTWGADFRVRDEYVDKANMLPGSATAERNVMRMRTRLWSSVAPVEGIALNMRLAWEARYFFRPDPPAVPGGHSGSFDEILFDNMNLRFTNLFNTPTTLTAGRQDYLTGIGSGWWLMDGTPLDGSRTYFLDSARLTYDLADAKTVINGIFVYQKANSDAWLAPINQQSYRYYLTEQDQMAGILYLQNKSIEKTQLDLYFVLDNDDKVMANGNEGYIYAVGARGVVDATDRVKISGEIMPQFGSHWNYSTAQVQNYQALAAQSQITYSFKDKLNNTVRAGYEFLSGDDPTTSEYERSDLIWGRYPRYSELLVYNPTTGPRTGDLGNYHRFTAGWSINPFRKTQFALDYHALFSVEHEAVYGTQTTGDFRGHLVTALLEYTFNKHLKGHLRAEFFAPGSYYDGTGASKEMETFLRAELYGTW